MVQKIDIAGVHMQVGDDLKKYIFKKIGSLDRYVPRASRTSLHVEVKLKESNPRGKSERTCEIIMHLPHEVLNVKETTINIYAAVDIAEEKLKVQLKKYKDLHGTHGFRRRVLTRLKRSPA
ncbi:MAG TPA: ribosome-associated translation inhibitor RaiA [Candidatus Saccharimonadales bacterium]|nr:ribosome-associated translation inhibitor RaiA [Candidatus Saccharimonadales bacterium]